MDLARLIADIEPRHSDQADFAFCARFDTLHDKETVSYVARKFNTSTYTSHRKATGWPAGCNNLFFTSLRWAIDNTHLEKSPEYRAILMMESDDCPLSKTWIADLLAEMDSQKRDFVGSFHYTPKFHYNGNMLFNGDSEFLKWLRPQLNCPTREGWDTYLFPLMEARGAADTKKIRSVWNMPGMDEATWDRFVSEGCSFLHGVKDDSARKLARKKLL